MRLPRFRIRTLMIAVAVAAVLLAAYASGNLLTVALSSTVPAAVLGWAVLTTVPKAHWVRWPVYSLIAIVTILMSLACPLPYAWGRGGFLEGGTVLPGWAFVLGAPPFFCCIGWPSSIALIVSAKWLWEGRSLGAFLLGCLAACPGLFMLRQQEPGRLELRTGFYVWFSGVVTWMVGVGLLFLVDLRKCGFSAIAARYPWLPVPPDPREPK
jgi:hypothetical protein